MRLFYAQSGNNKVAITAPYKTFASKEFDSLYGVKPYAYTTKSGERKNFKAVDFVNINYYPQNSGHLKIEIIFSEVFSETDAAVLHFKAMFASKREHIFSLPYVRVSTVTFGEGSTLPRTLAITRTESPSNPTTVFKLYKDSFFVETKAISSKSFSTNIGSIDDHNTSTLEFVGITTEASSDYVIQSFNNNTGKFLSTLNFTETLAKNSSFFYVLAENLSLVALETGFEGDGCMDPIASNADDYAFNDSSCTYVYREPGNIEIQTVVTKLTDLTNTVSYIEKNLTDSRLNSKLVFSPYIIVKSAPGVLATSYDVNGKSGYSEFIAYWDLSTVSSSLDTPIGLDDPFARIRVTDSIESEIRDVYFPIFKTQTIGCTDSSALNYESGATPCSDCCLYCTDMQTALAGIQFTSPLGLAGVNDYTNDDNTTVAVSSSINFGGLNSNELYSLLASYANTVWTCNLYTPEQVSLSGNVGEQASITGSALATLTNIGLNGTVLNFIYPPTVGSGLYPGSQYIAEYVFSESGCTFYVYKTFIIPFDGCMDPLASNFNPLIGNTGNGTCIYPINPTVCTQSIISSVSSPTLINNYNASFSITILGQSSDGFIVDNFGQYTVSYILQDISSAPAGFLGAYTLGTNVIAGPSNPQIFNIIIPPNSAANIAITETFSGCTEYLQITHPGIQLFPGCTDINAANYNPTANTDDGSCLYCEDITLNVVSAIGPTGSCTTSNTDGKILFEVLNAPGNFYIVVTSLIAPEIVLNTNVLLASGLAPGVYSAYVVSTIGPNIQCTSNLEAPIAITVNTSGCGCTNANAINYDPTATIDDGSCIIVGCTDPLAINYDNSATANDGSCIYSATPDTPYCIPQTVDNKNTYDVTLNNIKRCISLGGTKLLFKIRGGLQCSLEDQIKINLVAYLLGRIGLECIYNCNYKFQHGDKEFSCKTAWLAGGPSGGELIWNNSTNYVKGDIVQYTQLDGTVTYFNAISTVPASTTPPSTIGQKWKMCENVVLPTGTETYLETFINFAQKFCLVCFSDNLQTTIQISNTQEVLEGITLENGNNIEL